MKQLIFITFALLASGVFSQEIVIGLYQNAEVKHRAAQQTIPERLKAAEIRMPFIDDFSTTYVYPDLSNYSDSMVFVSSSYAYLPYSVGVATFDALSQTGILYPYGSSFSFIADYLTSYDIRLDSVFTGSPHPSSASDSIYFSFVYQPQGMGDKPETDDSLVLEFYAPSQDAWYHVWSSHGLSLSNFQALYGVDWKPVMIAITDTAYLQEGFRFRFYNYASLADNSFPTWAGNVDIWNVDYIQLNAGRLIGDSIPEDLAFRQRQWTLLEQYYAMPWNQFLANPAAEMADDLDVMYTNYSGTLLNVTERMLVEDLSGTTAGYNSGLSASNLNPYTDTAFYRNPIPYAYSSLVSEKAEFFVRLAINSNTITDLIPANDTVHLYQRFYNYYAYDDGTAEAGYGLNSVNAKLALRFTLNIEDTLKAIDMFFNRTVNDANQKYFYLTIWADNAGKPGSIIYQQLGVKPEFEAGFNNFHTYILDEPQVLTGTFYIGWEQPEEEVLNIGYDRNTNHNDRLFYNTDGNWYASMYEGTVMMRPVLGSESYPYAGIVESSSTGKIYPNPVQSNSFLNIDVPTAAFVEMYASDGRLVSRFEGVNPVDCSIYKPGLYMVCVFDLNGQIIMSNKVLIIP